eukprot:Mycagemm_TRINITY_DN10254_c1_g2::TRINITY_DN10254_c1_g2_i2::g.3632::m.3632 type:complete len:161 gc:universal TRINITY_DN10254_c1_g2_i2:486-4(-)
MTLRCQAWRGLTNFFGSASGICMVSSTNANDGSTVCRCQISSWSRRGTRWRRKTTWLAVPCRTQVRGVTLRSEGNIPIDVKCATEIPEGRFWGSSRRSANTQLKLTRRLEEAEYKAKPRPLLDDEIRQSWRWRSPADWGVPLGSSMPRDARARGHSRTLR